MSRMLRRRRKTWLFASHMKEMEEQEDLLEPQRLVNGHLQNWAQQPSPPAARESESLVR